MIKIPIQKSIFLFIIVFNLTQFGVAQSSQNKPDNYKPVDKTVRKIAPKEMSEAERAEAIYNYITKNVKYDVKSFQSGVFVVQSPAVTFNKKIGVCQHYAELFTYMCKEVGLESKVVTGYSKGGSYIPNKRYLRGDHAWNVVRIDGQWYVLDATWGAGVVERKKQAFNELLYKVIKKPYNRNKLKFTQKPNPIYFKTKAEDFVITHAPVDPRFQLMDHIVSIETFGEVDSIIQESIKYQEGEPYDYADSLASFFETKSENQLLKEGFASQRYNYDNNFFLGNQEANFGYAKIVSAKNMQGMNLDTRIYFLETAQGHIQEAIYYLNVDEKMVKEYHEELKKNQKERYDLQYSAFKKYLKENDKRIEKNIKYVTKGKERQSDFADRIKLLDNSITALATEDKLSRIKVKPQKEDPAYKISMLEFAIDSITISTQIALQQNDSLFFDGNNVLNKEMRENRKVIDSLSRFCVPMLNQLIAMKSQLNMGNIEKENELFHQLNMIQEEKIELLHQNYKNRDLVDKKNAAALKGNYKEIRKNIKTNQANYKKLIQLGSNKEEILARYQEDKDTLVSQMTFMSTVFKDYLASNTINKKAMKMERKVLKSESKVIKKMMASEEIYFAYVKEEERMRYKREQKEGTMNLIQAKKWLKLADKTRAKMKRELEKEKEELNK